MTASVDSYGRSINYLRLSVTDRCNLRCLYCMPADGVPLIPRHEILSYEEIRTVVQAAAGLGISRVRLTGGEPLVRARLPELVDMLSGLEGIEELSLTTNGTLLKRYARRLKQAGLSRVNISLDTLRAERFRRITRLGDLEEVLAGIRAAEEAGLHPVKVNTVVMRGTNDDEIQDFARMTGQHGWHVRFIELMPFGDAAGPVPTDEVLRHIGLLGRLEPGASPVGNGPARYYRLAGAAGTIGFISPVTGPSFCSRCNRLRLSPDGKLRACLLADNETDLRAPLRNNAPPAELRRLIRRVIAAKPERHQLGEGPTCPLRTGRTGGTINHRMSRIGG